MPILQEPEDQHSRKNCEDQTIETKKVAVFCRNAFSKKTKGFKPWDGSNPDMYWD